MYGVSWSSPSRTIALCPEYVAIVVWSCAFSWPAWPALTRPRLYSSSVIRLNSSEPWPVNWSVTIDEPLFGSTSAAMPDSTRSWPVSAGGSLNRYQYSPLFEHPFEPAPRQLAVAILQETGWVLAGTFSTCVSGGCFPSLYGSSNCLRVPAGPCSTGCEVCVLVTFLPLTFVVIFFLTLLNR